MFNSGMRFVRLIEITFSFELLSTAKPHFVQNARSFVVSAWAPQTCAPHRSRLTGTRHPLPPIDPRRWRPPQKGVRDSTQLAVFSPKEFSSCSHAPQNATGEDPAVAAG